jgi:hypothetical protein|tara:strand:- start:330 stop:590 length:261 start_codon:yes stop_codon:yes gene_type:complete
LVCLCQSPLSPLLAYSLALALPLWLSPLLKLLMRLQYKTSHCSGLEMLPFRTLAGESTISDHQQVWFVDVCVRPLWQRKHDLQALF